MSRLQTICCVTSMVLVSAGRFSSAADGQPPPPIDVLLLPKAAVEEANTHGRERPELAGLVDNDPATVVRIAAVGGAPVTIIFGLGGELVSIEKLVITLPPEASDEEQATGFDLLVSTVSPHAGFQSVRKDPLTSSPSPQEFPFTPIGARWVMLRLDPGSTSTGMAIADVRLLGHEGPPVTRYQFKESPAKAFDVLRQLEKISGLAPKLTDDEVDLFDDARDGKFDKWSFDEAALLASGVLDAAKRKQYLKQLDRIASDAKTALKTQKRPFGKGQALLKLLHAGPMSKGYVASQTDLAGILDTQTFNCVSSATLFNIVGRRLGLDCRAIEVPQHAFSIVYDGVAHADVETTTERGFNPSRDAAAQEAFSQLTGFSYIPDSDRDLRRELGEVGLVAIGYYNHGVVLTEADRYHEALLEYFRAMSLDPESDSAVKNALAALANWSLELARQAKFEESLNVLTTGLNLAPEDATLVHNRQAVWGQWAESLMNDGKSDEALALLRRAANEVPDGNFLQMQSWVFIRQGEEHAKAGQWQQALAVVEPGLQKLDGESRQELEEWGGNLYHRWAQSEQENSHFEQAIGVLQQAMAVKTGDASDELANHLAYIVQEWARDTQATKGAEQAEALVADMLTRFGEFEDVRDVADAYAYRAVKELVAGQMYDEALAAAERLSHSLKNEELARDLSHSVYDDWAEVFVKQENWEHAVEVYAKSLERFPGDEHLENNLTATWDRWARSYVDQQDWRGALDVYEKERRQLPDSDHAETNIRYCVQEWAKAASEKDGAESAEAIISEQSTRFADVEDMDDIAENHFQRVVGELSDTKQYDAALAVIERSKKMLKDADSVANLVHLVFDTRAEVFSRKQDWQAAIDVYTDGLKRFAGDAHLEQNAVATWYQWAKTYMDKKEWDEAAGIYERALKQFPDNGVLQNNLEFCRQQQRKSE